MADDIETIVINDEEKRKTHLERIRRDAETCAGEFRAQVLFPDPNTLAQSADVHPLQQQILADVRAFTEKYNLKLFTTEGFTTMSPYLHPETKEQELDRAVAAAKYYEFLFWVDDLFSANARTLEAVKIGPQEFKDLFKTLKNYNFKSGEGHNLGDLPLMPPIVEFMQELNDITKRDFNNYAQQLKATFGDQALNSISPEAASITLDQWYKVDMQLDKDITYLKLGDDTFIKITDLVKSNDPEIIGIYGQMKGAATWLHRFRDATLMHLGQALNVETDPFISGKVPTLEEFHKMRILDSGMVPTDLLGELSRGTYLDPDFVKEKYPTISRNMDANRGYLILVCSYINDIVSFPKEVLDADSLFNLVPIIAILQDIGTSEAITHSAKIVNNLYTLFMQTKEYITSSIQGFDPLTKKAILNQLQSRIEAIQATMKWQFEGTDRYKHSQSPFAHLKTET